MSINQLSFFSLLADKDHTAVVLLIGDYYIFIFLSRHTIGFYLLTPV